MDNNPRRLKLCLIICAMLLVLFSFGKGSAVGSGIIIVIAGISDRLAFKRIGKPKFWIFSSIILLAAGLLLGDNPQSYLGVSVSVNGLLAGIGMNLRALGVILGFVLISRTVTQERLFDLTGRIGLGHYVPAFSSALGTLPRMTAVLKEGASNRRWLNWDSLADILLMAREMAREPAGECSNLFAVTGSKQGGKTTFVKMIIAEARIQGKLVGGFIQEYRPQADTGRPVYDIVHLCTDERMLIAQELKPFTYQFSAVAFETASQWLEEDLRTVDIAVIDEMGALESSGQGHYPGVAPLLARHPNVLFVLTVRKDRLETICSILGIVPSHIIDIDDDKADRSKFLSGALEMKSTEALV